MLLETDDLTFETCCWVWLFVGFSTWSINLTHISLDFTHQTSKLDKSLIKCYNKGIFYPLFPPIINTRRWECILGGPQFERSIVNSDWVSAILYAQDTSLVKLWANKIIMIYMGPFKTPNCTGKPPKFKGAITTLKKTSNSLEMEALTGVMWSI